jgi:pantoate--beta-alanine ligase
LRAYGKQGMRALVPTMGALHDGHIRLVEEARKDCDQVIVSIFVNPRQFAPHEDFARYPRQVEADIARLREAGADAVYLPQEKDLYPEGFATNVSVRGVTEMLEGEFRPHFFAGVATVVAKLFLQVAPDRAYFGEKDYQQLQVVKILARDLDLPLEVIGVPTLRDPESGLALSSRNAYLDAGQMEIAVRLNAILSAMAGDLRNGDAVAAIEAKADAALLAAGFTKIDYCAIRDAETLLPYTRGEGAARILAAAWIGAVRLIDNIPA